MKSGNGPTIFDSAQVFLFGLYNFFQVMKSVIQIGYFFRIKGVRGRRILNRIKKGSNLDRK